MTTIKTLPGLPKTLVWILTLTTPTALFWLSFVYINPYLTLVLSIALIAIVYPLVTLLPRPKIFLVMGDESILMLNNEIHNSEVTLLELYDASRFGGWHVNLFTKWGDKPAESIPLTEISDGDRFLSVLPRRMTSASLDYGYSIWGSWADWVLILVITLLTLGVIRFFILLFV